MNSHSSEPLASVARQLSPTTGMMDDIVFRPPLHCAGTRVLELESTSRRFLSVEAERLLEGVRQALGRDPEEARTAALQFVDFLATGCLAGRPHTRGGLAPWQKRKVDRYIREQLTDQLQVAQIAQQISLSVSHFCRAFKQSFGVTPHTHITRLRLELAQRLMLNTEEPLSQIALACGLADQAHLSKLFRRAVGDSPGSWRRRNLSEAQVNARGRR